MTYSSERGARVRELNCSRTFDAIERDKRNVGASESDSIERDKRNVGASESDSKMDLTVSLRSHLPVSLSSSFTVARPSPRGFEAAGLEGLQGSAVDRDSKVGALDVSAFAPSHNDPFLGSRPEFCLLKSLIPFFDN
ncbi:hypothetical protein G5I_02392 [Acromyrmex echinatior]|uniref:Uncharacterized protein n=1 Tax=Acromyrmex echinatior TaxID=103372 RepID=F4WA72_ACREC|nr:hypothetical protein G5I_02392 [Acromyrmex echinatior]